MIPLIGTFLLHRDRDMNNRFGPGLVVDVAISGEKVVCAHGGPPVEYVWNTSDMKGPMTGKR